MKLVLILSLLVALSSWAKTVSKFSKVLNEDVKEEIQADDEKFKKKSFRGPASVESVKEPVIKEVPKIDKNIRQIGPNKW